LRHGVALGVLVVDNANYGTIRMHQDRHGSAATATSALGPVDIAGFARSLGADAITVTGDDQVAEAIDALVSATRPLVVDVKVDPGQNHVNQA
jgi:acetolactate synthase-1/2/3 large subunit